MIDISNLPLPPAPALLPAAARPASDAWRGLGGLARLLAALLALATPVPAQTEAQTAAHAQAQVQGPLPEGNPEALRIIEEAAATCAAEEAGDLVVKDGAYTAYDLDMDGETDDLVVSFDHIHCQFSMVQWAGTGGTPKWFILNGDTALEIWGGQWRTIDVLPYSDDPGEVRRLILMPVHGIYCDGFGAQPCWRAIATFDGQFSTMPPLPE